MNGPRGDREYKKYEHNSGPRILGKDRFANSISEDDST